MVEHVSEYLRWYDSCPKLKYDLRASGISNFTWTMNLGKLNFSENFSQGNPEAKEKISDRYGVAPENVFIMPEGASGVNVRTIKCLASRKGKTEAVVEYPVYEPLLRQVQSYFSRVKRVDRRKRNSYKLGRSDLEKMVSKKTALLMITNPHAPTGMCSSKDELEKIGELAEKYEFYILCDEIYAEFDRSKIPTMFSVNPKWGITTTSFSKAYGLGGLKAGIALASEELVEQLYSNVLSSTGCGSNLVELVLTNLLTKGKETMERHKQKWLSIREKTVKWLKEAEGITCMPNDCGVVFWLELEKIIDTYRWTNEFTIPKMGIATVPGAFFLYRSGYEIVKSNAVRLGVGNMNADVLEEALSMLEKAIAEGERLNF